MTPLEAAWKAVLEHPEDDRALSVLSDALSEQGDPHGELIRMGLAPDVDLDAVHLFVATHATELLGDVSRLHHWAPVFERGFISRAGTVSTARELEALLTRPVGRLLRELRVNEPPSQVVKAVIRSAPVLLQRLTMTSAVEEESPFALAPLLEALPRLERLHLGLTQIDWVGARSSSLKTLGVELWPRTQLMGPARFPMLDSLYLTLSFGGTRPPPELLEGVVTPTLRTLTIAGALWPAQLELLAASPLLAGLRSLHLLGETATGWYPVLLQRADAFRHLERLSVRPDAHHAEWVTAVRELFPNVVVVTETPALGA
ncbi:MAG: hypothetical protein QM817_15405 [Archangium sp.]